MPLEIHDVGEHEASGLLAVYRDKNRWRTDGLLGRGIDVLFRLNPFHC